VFSVCRLVSRRCHAISPIRRFVPGSSQNRTWSVTPSGSQFESFPIGWAQRPIDSRRPLPRNAGRLRACPTGTARRPSEACLTLLPRTESSQCRAVYHPHAVSNRHPFAPPALPGIDTTIGGSDFRTPPPASSPFSLVHGCPHPADRDTDLLGYRAFSLSGSTWPRSPGSTGTARRRAVPDVACERGQCRRRSPTKIFGAQHLQGRLHPLPLHLACFRAYASTRPLPFAPQGSILGSWLATTQVGFAPTRLRDIAKPH
jgi:hypothetical protein